MIQNERTGCNWMRMINIRQSSGYSTVVNKNIYVNDNEDNDGNNECNEIFVNNDKVKE